MQAHCKKDNLKLGTIWNHDTGYLPAAVRPGGPGCGGGRWQHTARVRRCRRGRRGDRLKGGRGQPGSRGHLTPGRGGRLGGSGRLVSIALQRKLIYPACTGRASVGGRWIRAGGDKSKMEDAWVGMLRLGEKGQGTRTGRRAGAVQRPARRTARWGLCAPADHPV